MAQFLNFGNGSDAAATLSGTFSPIDSSCAGTGNGTNRNLSATNASFSAGQMILIHQTRGTGVGAWEINQIESYIAGTITCVYPLVNTYTDSGASQAQVLVLPQYSSVTVSGTLTAKAWDGNVGGIIAFLCSGRVTVSGTISANGTSAGSGNESAPTGAGFAGGSRATGSGSQAAAQGEGSVGAGSTSTAANGSAGGGASKTDAAYAGGGGGGHNGAGSAGSTSIVSGSATAGSGGGSVGSSALSELHFGGGGGGGVKDNSTDAGCGGAGAGIILIFGREIVITGTVIAAGGTGGHYALTNHGGGGGGGGGTIFLKGESVDYSSGTVSVAGGTPGNAAGPGAVGRIRIEACSRSGSVLDTESLGGYSFCSSDSQIF